MLVGVVRVAIVAQSFQPVDLYGGLVPQATHECAEADSVRLVTIWDRTHRELLWFLDAPQFEAHREPDGYEPDALLLIRAERWPFRLSLPGDSPFCAFVPMWAVDQPFGISQIQHVRNQGTEVDALRTRVANLTRQLKRVFGYDKNAIGSEQVDAALRSQDWALLGLDVQEGRRLSDLFSEFPMPQVHAELFRQIAQATQDIRFQKTGALRIATLPALSQWVVPRAVAGFLTTRPNVSVFVQSLPSRQIAELVAESWDIRKFGIIYGGHDLWAEGGGKSDSTPAVAGSTCEHGPEHTSTEPRNTQTFASHSAIMAGEWATRRTRSAPPSAAAFRSIWT